MYSVHHISSAEKYIYFTSSSCMVQFGSEKEKENRFTESEVNQGHGAYIIWSVRMPCVRIMYVMSLDLTLSES